MDVKEQVGADRAVFQGGWGASMESAGGGSVVETHPACSPGEEKERPGGSQEREKGRTLYFEEVRETTTHLENFPVDC